MDKNLFILFLLALFNGTNLVTQHFEVSGQIVYEFNTLLPGSNVYIKNNTKVAIKYLDGSFTIQATFLTVFRNKLKRFLLRVQKEGKPS